MGPEIVVTARKRDEKLQDVPISISVMESGELTRRNLQTIGDIARQTPGLQFSQGFGPDDTRVTLRGISTVRGRPAVAVLEDGIDTNGAAIGTVGGGSVMNSRLLDVERIEVVRGPQSTIYGRNAFAGAINYVTKGPTDEFEAGMSGNIATHDLYDVGAYISGPVTNNLSLRVNGSYHNFGGFYRNVTSGVRADNEESYGGRIQAKWQPLDNLTVLARYAYSNNDVAQGAVTLMTANASAPNGTRYVQGKVEPNPAGISTFGDPRVKSHSHKGDINISLDLGGATLSSETYLLRWRADQNIDAGFSQLPGLATGFSIRQIFDASMKTDQFSQELRIASNGDTRLKYLFGAYYLNEKAELIDRTYGFFASCANPLATARPGLGCSPALNQVSINMLDPAKYPASFEKRDTEHFSFYGSLGYEVLDGLNVTGELRYTTETVDVAHPQMARNLVMLGFASTTGGPFTAANFLSGGGFTLPQVETASTRSHYFNPRVSIDYHVSPTAMIYGSFAKGTKPGGFSQLTGTEFYANNSYRPEKLYSWELGIKGNTPDRKLLVNATVFLSRYLDQQVNYNTVVPVAGVNFTRTAVTNAGQVNSHGLELQATMRPIPQFTVNWNYAYTISKYKTFNSVDSLSRALFPLVTNDAGNVAGDLSGNYVPDVPKHAASLSTRWEDIAFGETKYSIEILGSYVGKRFINSDASNTAYLGDYVQVDMNAGLTSPTWSLTAYVTNLLQDDTPRAAFRFSNLASATASELAAVVYSAPKRQVGLRASYKF